MNRSFISVRCLAGAIAACLLLAGAPPVRAFPGESPEARDARMEWWRDARFGMFIHWGLYSVPAGIWNDKKIGGIAEWIQQRAQIPVAEYTQLKDRFNPEHYDADAWVRLARDAGMRYIVITTKHHDGFCLWDSAHTDWDITATPYRRDLLEPLAEACRKYGIKLCFYYSIMDWHHPQYGTKHEPWSGNSATESPDMDAYIEYMKAHLRELLTRYGDIGVLWFDGEWEESWTHERGKDLDDFVRSLQPDIIINNRVDKGRRGMSGFNVEGEFRGDFSTPEQEIPATGLPGVDWESCMTMNETWGFSSHDTRWKSTANLIRNLIDTASKGGNYLLNIGPKADGAIPEESVTRLREIGQWMATNAEAIHGTTASPFARLLWGRCTVKPGENNTTTLYFHIFDWPEDGVLKVRGITNKITGARLLARPDDSIEIRIKDDNLVSFTLPGKAPDPIASVLAVTIEGQPVIIIPPLRPGADGNLVMDAGDADIQGRRIRIETQRGEPNIGYWKELGDIVSFQIEVAEAGPHSVTMRWACPPESAGGRFDIQLVDPNGNPVSTLPVTASDTRGWNNFKSDVIGVLAVPSPGMFTVRVVPVDIKGNGLPNLGYLRMRRMP